MPKRIPKPLADCLRCKKQRLLTSRRLCASCDTRYYSYKLRLSKESPGKTPTVEEFIMVDPARSSGSQQEVELLPTTELIPGFVISSPAMRQVVHKLERAARHDVSVLIVGETGVGKEYVARAIHDLSTRSGRPFVTIDSPSLTPDLASSELFGHDPGAFTGAKAATHGLFGQADGGTVFIDELSALNLDIQPKLLRALESKTIRRVGGSAEKSVDVRIISATNVPLRTLVEDRRFRSDLLYRLNVFPITIPPLRARRTDIPVFAERFLSQLGRGEVTLSIAAANALEAYPWPGNVRELYHAIEYATIMQEDGVITKDHLPEEVLFPERALLPETIGNFH